MVRTDNHPLGLALDKAFLAWLVVVTFLVYQPATRYGFLNYDDFLYVAGNPMVRGGFTLHGFLYAFTARIGYYTPVTILSYLVESTIAGGSGAGIFHLANILLHCANTAMVFLLLAEFGLGFPSKMFVTALFALHPLQVESVAWVSEQKGLLASLFALVAAREFLSAATQGEPRFTRRFWVFYALSILSKPCFLPLPWLLPVLSLTLRSSEANPFAFVRQIGSTMIKLWRPLLVVPAVSLAAVLLQSASLDVSSPWTFHFSRSFGSVWLYCFKAVLPADLMVPYIVFPWRSLQGWAAGAALLLTTWLLLRLRRARPAALAGWLWFLGLLYLSSGIVTIGKHGFAHRYFYLPSAGLFVMGAALLPEIIARRPVDFLRPVAAVLLIFWAAILSRHELGFWRDTDVLFSRALSIQPSNYLARELLYQNAMLARDYRAAQAFVLSNAEAARTGRDLGLLGAYFPYRDGRLVWFGLHRKKGTREAEK
jgi:hypothetical protein